MDEVSDSPVHFNELAASEGLCHGLVGIPMGACVVLILGIARSSM
jgi:hypothetical protein